MVNTSALKLKVEAAGSNPVQDNFQSFTCVCLCLYFTAFSLI